MNMNVRITGGGINPNIDMAAVFCAASEAVADEARAMCPVDTGKLKSSITVSAGDDGAQISANADYAAYVEFGTYKTAAQPFLVPALLNSADKIAAAAAKAIGEGL